MKKLFALLAAAMLLSLLSACSSGTGGETQAPSETKAPETTPAEPEPELSDEELAAHVAELIDAIYVQKRTDETDAQCAAAKEAWDALTEEQKLLVEGKYADYDYFGRDTGDASLDDPRNQDDIGENEILVVSFGTSFNSSRVADLKGIEDALAAAFPQWSIRRAFTSQIIINHIQARDNEFIDNMDQALERAVANGVKNLVVQPTHLMHGAEYDEMCEAIDARRDQFETVLIAEPLLGPVGADATVINADKQAVAQYVVAAAVADAGYASLEEAAEDGAAFVLMGHGTSHNAKVTYSQMTTQMASLGYDNVFIGTVEGEPEETAVENVMEAVSAGGYSKVVLRPLMVVAGDHAENDMAGDDEDSWKSMFLASGDFESVDCQISGLGSIAAVQQLYVAHTAEAICGTLEDGVYTVDFNTDSAMFHVSEACDGKGTLTVENGVMTLHVSLSGTGYLTVFPGLAADAEKHPEGLIEHTVDTVTYPDGLTEEVHGFDIPVPYIGADFDLATLGKKGTWYDHRISVSNPLPVENS